MINIDFKTPYEAVFLKKYGKDGTRLFKNQTDLSNAVISIDTYFQSKNPTTVRTSICQIFSGQRNLSTQLEEAMFKAIEMKFDKVNNDFGIFKDMLIAKINLQFEQRTETKRNVSLGNDLSVLMDRIHTARFILVSCLEPIEFFSGQISNTIKDELLRKIGILRKPEYITRGSYIFLFPRGRDKDKNKIARMFWSRILDYCVEFHKIERKDAEQLLFAANERGDLRTYLIDAGSVTLPNVFLDYNLPKISGYATSYNKVKDTLNVIEYPRENCTEWKDTTYHHLTNVMNEEDSNYKFSDFLYNPSKVEELSY